MGTRPARSLLQVPRAEARRSTASRLELGGGGGLLLQPPGLSPALRLSRGRDEGGSVLPRAVARRGVAARLLVFGGRRLRRRRGDFRGRRGCPPRGATRTQRRDRPRSD